MAAKTTEDTPLTQKEERFCLNYFASLNATQAYIDTYETKNRNSARVQVCRVLAKPNVSIRLANMKAELAGELGITAERVVKEYAKVGFTNMEDFTQDSDDGLTLKELSKIGRDNMAAVESVRITTTTERDGKGKPTRTHRTSQFKLHSKLNALDALGKHLGIFGLDNLQKGTTLADVAAIFAAARSKE